jgi:hypothetical protein
MKCMMESVKKMKKMYSKRLITKAMGILDIKDGKYIIANDGVEYDLLEIIKDMVGGEISISSEQDVEI